MQRLAAIFALAAAPAFAQSATTTCYLGGAIVTCTTPGAQRTLQPNDYTLPDAGNMIQDSQRRDAEIAALRAAARPQELRERVGRKLAKGDCAGAEKNALEGGDLDLASKVRAYCAAK